MQNASFAEALASKMTKIMLTTAIILSAGGKLLEQINPAVGQSAACKCDHHHNSDSAVSS